MTVNNSLNSTVSEFIEEIPLKWKYAIYSIILIVSLFGNFLLAYSLLRVKRKHFSITNLLIINLAFCEVLVVFDSVSIFIITSYVGYFPFGTVGCKIIYPLATYGVNAVVALLVALSMERYTAVCYPFLYRKLKRYSLPLLLTCHIVAICGTVPYSYVSTMGEYHCIETWSVKASAIYTIFLFVMQYLLPLPIFISLYSYTWYKIKRQNDNIIKLSEKHGGTQETDLVQLKHTRSRLIHQMKREKHSKHVRHIVRRLGRNSKRYNSQIAILRHKQTASMLKLFIVIVLVFAVFMLPNQIMWFYTTVANTYFSDTFITICDWLTYANAIMNPFIYGMNEKYRRMYVRNIKKFFRVCFREIRTRGSTFRSDITEIKTDRSQSLFSTDSTFSFSRTFRYRSDSLFSEAETSFAELSSEVFKPNRQDSLESVEVVLREKSESAKTRRYKVKTCLNESPPITPTTGREYLDLFFPDERLDIKSHRLYKSALTNSIKKKYLSGNTIEDQEAIPKILKRQEGQIDNELPFYFEDASCVTTQEKERLFNRLGSDETELYRDSDVDDDDDCKIRINSDIYIDKKNRLSVFKESLNVLNFIDNDPSQDMKDTLARLASNKSDCFQEEIYEYGTSEEEGTPQLKAKNKRSSEEDVENLDIDDIEIDDHLLKIDCSSGRRHFSFIFNTKKHDIMTFLNEGRETNC